MSSYKFVLRSIIFYSLPPDYYLSHVYYTSSLTINQACNKDYLCSNIYYPRRAPVTLKTPATPVKTAYFKLF